MSAKTCPPYRVIDYQGAQWIVDNNNYDVLTSFTLSPDYYEVYGEAMMQIICDALNKKERIAETISGTLISAGDMTIDGETVSGVFVEVDREALKNIRIPFYKAVTIEAQETQEEAQ